LCYKQNHHYGFGGFIRWIYLSCPNNLSQDVIGIDWGIGLRKTSGITTSVLSVAVLCRNMIQHGVLGGTRIALLDPNLCEITFNHEVIQSLELYTTKDWANSASTFFHIGSEFCPRCGLQTFKDATHRFCYRCAADPQTIHAEVYHD
ncbi:MAG: hypothetical protein AAB664_00060, partial [Patescibacteria group bacterium]